MDLTPRKRSKIITLVEYAGKTQREIATLCRVSQSVVSKLVKLYKASDSLSPKRKNKCGRKRKTTASDDRYILQQSRIDPKKTSDALERDLSTHRIDVSSSTVRRRLLEAGRPARKPYRKQLLTTAMKKRDLHGLTITRAGQKKTGQRLCSLTSRTLRFKD